MRRFQALKNFNAFPHAEDHLLQKTFSGAIGVLLIFVIVYFGP
jgi:endoplasmic reticulum-Golgi intermediate compartment protein 3